MKTPSDATLWALIFFAAATSACGSATKTKTTADAGPPDLGGFFMTGDMAMQEDQDLAVVETDAGTGPANASCTGAITLTNGTPLTGQDTTGATTMLNNVCQTDGEGSVLFYTIAVPAGNKMTVEVTPTDGVFDPVLRVLETCASTSCAASADSGYEGDAEMTTYVNAGAATKNVVIAVGAYDSMTPGKFDIKVTMGTFAPNAVCMGAVALTSGTPKTAQDAAGAAAPNNACLFADGNVLYYSISVPARNKLDVTVTPTGTAMWDPVVRVLATCTATSCLASADEGSDGDAESASYRNLTLSAMNVLIAVGGNSSTDTGVFDIVATNTALPPPPTNTDCTMPIVVTDGTMLTGQSATEGVDVLSAACESSADGKVLYYSASIPAHSKLTAKVTPTGSPSWDAVARILPMCALASGCLASADSGGSGGVETVTYDNTTAAPKNVILAVGSYDPDVSGTFNLAVTIVSSVPVQPNAVCAMATAMTNGQTKTAEDLAGTTVTEDNICLSLAVGPVLFYSISVPAGQRLIAYGKPADNTWDLAMRLLDTCAASSCLASADSEYEGGAEALSFKNAGGAAKPVVISVGNYTKDVLGKFDISTWLRTTPTNLMCAQSIPIANGTSVVAEDGESATAASSGTCVPSGTGKSLFYSVSIPAGKTLTVNVQPLGSWDPVVRLTATCAATACLASADVGANGDPETLTYKNTGAGLQPVVIAVGGYGATEAFNMQVTLQ